MLKDIFIKYLDEVFAVYGLAFFAMGIVILAQPRKKSIFKLSDIIWLLAAFGLSHGLNEWLDMFAIDHQTDYIFVFVKIIVLVISYVFLFEFGRRFVLLSYKDFFNRQITYILCLLVFLLISLSKYDRSIWPRYLLGLPGGILSGVGFILYYYSNYTVFKTTNVAKYFISAGIFLIIYGIFGGLFVQKSDFFPASVINTDLFLNYVGFPVQALRAFCSIVISVSVWKILSIFNWEIAEREKEFAVITAAAEAERKRADELEKAYKDLQDTEEKLVRTEKLAVLGKLSSMVAHEIRNPLSVIKAAVYNLSESIPANNDKMAEKVKLLSRQSDRIEKIITDVLEYSRIQKIDYKFTNINQQIKEVLDSLKQIDQFPSNILLDLKLKDDLPDILADPDGLKRVFQNIISNAIDAMPDGGKISIATQLVKETNLLDIIFSDTGMGMSEKQLSKIWEPFFSTKTKGTGLGLAISKGIIERHKGSIDLRSEVNRGTTFIIHLPLFLVEGSLSDIK